ncbi:hypothetical protein L0F63_005575 [Massospora cicadina]|nr:hypothetical protein L0F63_005575 [Massospora cicadina]
MGFDWYIFLGVVVVSLAMWWGRRGRGGIPHVEYDLPVVGHTWQLVTNPKDFLTRCRRRYGDAFSVSFLGKRIYILCGKGGGTIALLVNFQNLYLVQALGRWEASPTEGTISGLRVVVELVLPIANRIQPALVQHVHEAIDSLRKGALGLEELVGSVIASTFGLIIFGKLAKQQAIEAHLKHYSRRVEAVLGYGMVVGMVPLVGPIFGKFMVSYLSPTWQARREIHNAIVDHVQLRQAQPSQPSQSVLDSLADAGHPPVAIANALLLVFATVGSTTRAAQQHLIHLLATPHSIPELRLLLDPALDSLPKDGLGYPLIYNNHPFMASAFRESLRHFTHRLEGWRRLAYDLPLRSGKTIPPNSIALDFPNLHLDPEIYGQDALEFKLSAYLSQLVGLYVSALIARYDVVPMERVDFHTNPYIKDIKVHLVERERPPGIGTNTVAE